MAFSIGKTFHLIHITDDYEELAAWYSDVFDGLAEWVGFDGFPYLDVEIRDADLIVIADCVVEPMAPAQRIPGWEQAPVGRFYQKFGRRWQTISWYVEGLPELYDRLADRGVRFFLLGGGSGDDGLGDNHAFFTHPKDTAGGLEFSDYWTDVRPARPPSKDPRFYPGFDPSWWAKNHPLGVERLGYMTVVVDDLDRAKDIYLEGLDGKLLWENTSELTGTRNAYIGLGTDTVVELAKPVDDSSIAAKDLARNGEFFHAVTWKVVDLDRAAAHLKNKNITIVDRDEHTLTTDPETTYGAVFRFTTWTPPGDPRD